MEVVVPFLILHNSLVLLMAMDIPSLLKINDAENHYQGAFAYIGAGGTVKNLITSGTVSVVKSKYYVGGIAGMCEGTIQDCGNTAAVTGSKQVGGITGQLSDKSVATIQNCYNTGTITGPSSGRPQQAQRLAA